MCLSTSARESLVRGFDVLLDPDATAARDLSDPRLGSQTADDVRRSALLQLVNMGAKVITQTASPRQREATPLANSVAHPELEP
jgi:hypothetical protein